jgi:arsenate reductase
MSNLSKKMNILFLCTGNSCRSQMAEAFTRALHQDLFVPYSAGVVAKGVDPRAVKAMAEVGLDISGQSSKSIDDLPPLSFDVVVTVCSRAKESCPFFPGDTIRLHRDFDDPPELAAGAVDEEAALAHYRRVRDEIQTFVENLPRIVAEAAQGRNG